MNEEQIKELNETLKDIKNQVSNINTYLETITKVLAMQNGITIIDNDDNTDIKTK